jgi:nitrate/TMAO reductase-like tetraheme cytochrome c subunit
MITENRSIILYTTNESKAVGMLQADMANPRKLVPKNFEIVFMKDLIPQDKSLLALAESYRKEIRETQLNVDKPNQLRADEVPGVKAAAGYAGSAACATCHATESRIWQNTRHAHAFASLQARHSEADPNCISCHTIGFGTATGYLRAFGSEKLTDVGCESCHGPGSEHVAQRQSGEKVFFHYRPLGAADCTSCHHGEFSRPFEWEAFWAEVKHGKPRVAIP